MMFLSAFILTSCSFGSPKSGDECGYDPENYKRTENARGTEMYCDEYNMWRHVG